LIEELRGWILREALPGEDPSMLGPDDNLLRSGILDSLIVVKLLHHLRVRYGVQARPDEVNPRHFGTVRTLAAFVEERRSAG
jgi:acyl carrier protein